MFKAISKKFFTPFVILPIILSLFIISFLPIIITYTACTTQNDVKLRDEIAIMDKLVDVESPQEIRIKQTMQIQKLKETKKDLELTDKLLQKIKSIDPANLSNTQTAIDYTITKRTDKIVTGFADFHILFEYSDGASGYAVNRYNFTFDKNSNQINVNLLPENAPEDTRPVTSVQISEQEKREIESRKAKATKPKPKTLQSVQDEAKISSKEYFKKTSDQLKAKHNCFGIKAEAASGGNYARYSARDYAIKYASDFDTVYDSGYNKTDYFNYNGSGFGRNGSDCANFVSQAVFAGGLAKDYGNNSSGDRDWYFHWDYPKKEDRTPVASTTWIRVTDQMTHMYWRENTGPWYQFRYNQFSQFDNLFTGDLIFVDWYDTGTFGHIYIITGWNWVDNNHWEPRLSAHSTNRNNISYQEMLNFAKKQGKSVDKINFKGLPIYSYVW